MDTEMKLNICTMMKDSVRYKGHFINQTHRFFKQIDNQVRLNWSLNKIVCLVSKSEDDTYDQVIEHEDDHNLTVLYDEEPSEIHSIVSTTRFKKLSRLGNMVLDAAKDDCDAILWIESDIIIDNPYLISELCGGYIINKDVGAISPMVWLGQLFYDTLAFRDLSGKCWSAYYPYCSNYLQHKEFIPASSVGSCSLIQGRLIRNGLNFGDGCFMELCRKIRNYGCQILVMKNSSVRHPNSKLLDGTRWI
jgi:hypothetical protein